MKKLISSTISFSFVLFSICPVYSTEKDFKISKAAKKAAVNLKGSWQSQDEEAVQLIFNNNGTLTFDGDTLNYSISGNNINVETEEGIIPYPYILKGNILTVTFPEGYKMIFKKLSSQNQNVNTQNNNTNSSQNYLLNGNFCSYSSSTTYNSSYSSQNKVYFDGAGKFYYGGSESSMSSSVGSYYGNSGSQNVGTYKVSGKTIYLTDAQGETAQAQVHFINSTGISEVMYNGKLYGKALCN